MFYKMPRYAVFFVLFFNLSLHAFSQDQETMKIKLPAPDTSGSMTVEQAMTMRRSVRSYKRDDLTPQDISQLVWACQGITNERGFRTAPSAGASFPLEIYVARKDGVFYYDPRENTLLKTGSSDVRSDLSRQEFVAEAPVSIIICAVYERVSKKYGERGTRYTDIEVGHAAQNVHLEAVALGLASCPIGAFNDQNVATLLNLPADQKPVYIIPVGYEK